MTDSLSPLPWQHTLWEQLTQAYQSQKLAHAILLADRDGFGQAIFAKALARYILCHEQSPEQAHLFDLGHHPDFFYCVPEADSSVIKIEVIRELQEKLSKSSHAGRRVVVVEPAHALNMASTNALLKLLEEPSADIFFILISHEPNRLAKTLLSRCQRFYFDASPELTLEWLTDKNLKPATARYFLKLAEGSPLQAFEFSETESQQFRKEFLMDLNAVILENTSPVVMADKWAKKQPLESLLAWLYRWLLDVLRLHHGALNEVALPAPYIAILMQWKQKLNLTRLFETLQKCQEAVRKHSEIKGLNAQNSLESILIFLSHETH